MWAGPVALTAARLGGPRAGRRLATARRGSQAAGTEGADQPGHLGGHQERLLLYAGYACFSRSLPSGVRRVAV